MMGRRLQIDWQETAEELKTLYQKEKHPQRRTRLQALWHLRCGKRVQEVAEMLGVACRVMQRWLAWYRQGGLEAVLRRVSGHGASGVQPYLSALQQRALVARVAVGDFRTVWEVLHWVEARWGIRYSYEGMRSLMKRHKLGLKVPRPRSEKASLEKQAAWKKGGYLPL
jgi:transposase